MCDGILPCDLWAIIGSKLELAVDRIRFRAVSKSWRSLIPFRQPPWLVLPVYEDEDDIEPPFDYEEEVGAEEEIGAEYIDSESESSDEFVPRPPPLSRGFICLGDQQIWQIDFPEMHKARPVGSTGNWLITMHVDRTLRLLNPFSNHQIHLPPPRTFENRSNLEALRVRPEIYRDSLVWKVVLSSPPSPEGGGDWVAIAIHHSNFTMAIARPGDASWTTVQDSFHAQDAIFYKQQFHTINGQGRLMVCDIGSAHHPPSLSLITDSSEKYYRFQKHYLVEWLGELLHVIKVIDQFSDPKTYKTNRFEVYKLEPTTTKFVELESLGEHSLFLGFNTSISVRAADYHGSVKKNCIYFTDDYMFGYMGLNIEGGHDMGVFDLNDKTITPHYKETSTSRYCPPFWIVPT